MLIDTAATADAATLLMLMPMIADTLPFAAFFFFSLFSLFSRLMIRRYD